MDNRATLAGVRPARLPLGRWCRSSLVAAAAAAAVGCWPAVGFAYVGPGAGLSLLGSLWWLLVAVLTAIGVVLYWPIKVLIRWVRWQLQARKAPPKQDDTKRDGATADPD